MSVYPWPAKVTLNDTSLTSFVRSHVFVASIVADNIDATSAITVRVASILTNGHDLDAVACLVHDLDIASIVPV